MPTQPLDFTSPVRLNEAAREIEEPEETGTADEDDDDIEQSEGQPT